MNDIYHQLTLSRVASAVGAAYAVKGLDHSGVKGQLREIFIRDLLRPLMPADIDLGTGIIVTSTNQQSGQIDVVMFDRRIMPPVLWEGTSGIFPVESVLYTIEVKSTLTAAELRKAHDTAALLETLEYRSGIYDDSDIPQPHQFTKLIPVVFAFDSDLSPTGKHELDRYDEIRDGSDPALKVICVVGRGYWHWVPAANEWGVFTAQGGYPLAEIVAFIAGILNTYRKIAATRLEPRLGHYLL